MDFLKKYNINIKNTELLLTALTHSSYSNEHNCESYERLEFLGDAVLEVIISDYLYTHEDLSEGKMTKKRASYVCEEALAEYAKDINYMPYIRVGHGQIDKINDTIIADIFEAILGVIYLDQGFDVAKEYINKVVIPYIKKEYVFLTDYKSALQESVQTDKKTLEYVLVSEDGPSHNKTFTVEVQIDGIIFGKGFGKTKKEAEQNAAKDAFKRQAK
ncbi:MAG: ribonuclease III [Bacilli bacterium]|nr:ribonuclease III [Bacilli bacterium]